MTAYLLLAAAVAIACVIFGKLSGKIGVPALLAFILLGMFFGSDGIVKIPFDNYLFAEQLCSVALIFIMFYGGFGTSWSEARPVAARAIVLSSLGTALTAGLVGLFCHFVLKMALLESFLIGSVISSTDAASVFSILRSKRLNLKYRTASLLEIESGSNDPFSYMLTIIVLSLMNGSASGGGFVLLLGSQIFLGLAFGFGIAALTLLFLKKMRVTGFNAVFIAAVAVISYAAPTLLGGNGYLSTYITGIILGNSRIRGKTELVHFFDGATGLMQMVLFFLLGLLSFPSRLPEISLTALAIALFLTFIARPAAVFLLLTPFKCNLRQQLLVAWSGLRGAASIVFAIMVVISPSGAESDIFHIVFFIVLFSILLQGCLLPWTARRLGMTDSVSDVMKTFNDYMFEIPVRFVEFSLNGEHPWIGSTVRELVLPPDSLLILIMRHGERIIPNGSTRLESGDTLIMSGHATEHTQGLEISERMLSRGDALVGKTIAELPREDRFILLIRRADGVIIPRGDVELMAGDVLMFTDGSADKEPARPLRF